MNEYVIVEDNTDAECGDSFNAVDLEDAALQTLLSMGYRIEELDSENTNNKTNR